MDNLLKKKIDCRIERIKDLEQKFNEANQKLSDEETKFVTEVRNLYTDDPKILDYVIRRLPAGLNRSELRMLREETHGKERD